MGVNEEIRKVYYSIGEVAELLGLNPSMIRFWEKEFEILEPKKSRKGNRMFTEKDIENLSLIKYLLRDRGYTIPGANKRIKDNKQSAINESLVVDRLMYIRAELEKIKNQL